MAIDFTPLFRTGFVRRAKLTDNWQTDSATIQRRVLAGLLKKGAATEYGKKHGFSDILNARDPEEAFARDGPDRGV